MYAQRYQLVTKTDLSLHLCLLCVHQHEEGLFEVQESLWVSIQGQRGKLLTRTRCSSSQGQQHNTAEWLGYACNRGVPVQTMG